jgi:hypothetical protein
MSAAFFLRRLTYFCKVCRKNSNPCLTAFIKNFFCYNQDISFCPQEDQKKFMTRNNEAAGELIIEAAGNFSLILGE